MINIAPYNPQADGQIEHPNETIKQLMKLAQQTNDTLTHRETLDLTLAQYNGQKHSTIQMPPLLAEKLELTTDGFCLAGYTNEYEKEWMNTPYKEQKSKVNFLISTCLTKFASCMMEKYNAKWPILQFSLGK